MCRFAPFLNEAQEKRLASPSMPSGHSDCKCLGQVPGGYMDTCLCGHTSPCSQDSPWYPGLVFLTQRPSWAAGVQAYLDFHTGAAKKEPRVTSVSLHGILDGGSREVPPDPAWIALAPFQVPWYLALIFWPAHPQKRTCGWVSQFSSCYLV